jgi:hypothetical protein
LPRPRLSRKLTFSPRAIHTRWISLPAKLQITKDGSVRRDDRNKIVYSTVIEFTDRATRARSDGRSISRHTAYTRII